MILLSADIQTEWG